MAVSAQASASEPTPREAAPGLQGLTFLGANDDFGTGEILDRWRTGAIAVHGIYGRPWSDTSDVGMGEVWELRFRGEILAPESLDNPEPGDRPYAGTLSFGLHSHFRSAGVDYRAGVDLVLTGPQTGADDLQASIHDAMGLPDPANAAETQLGDSAYLTFSGEAARGVVLSPAITVRPFAAARIGDETFARIGVDLVGGSLASGGLLVRDVTTGQLFEATRGRATGFGWSIGADVAAVSASVYLPDSGGFPGPEPARSRVRAGAQWAESTWSLFGGIGYLSEEFEDQSEGQIVGAVALTFGF